MRMRFLSLSMALPRALITAQLLLFCLPIKAEVPIETYGGVEPRPYSDHTIAINTFSETILIYDADERKVLGMLSVGIGVNALEIDKGSNTAYAAETYLTRHTRGERTDVVTAYDLKTLSAIGEIEIPPKHASGAHLRHYSGILREDRTKLMVVTNITPAVSVSIVDLNAGMFLSELNTAGCGLVYPISGLSFLQLCGDGTAQLLMIDKRGAEQARIRSEVFFDLIDDPLMEKPVNTSNGWVFNTFKGEVFRLSVEGDEIEIEKLFSIADDDADWRVGGMQPLAYHQSQNLLFTLMHEGGEDSHKDPGTEIWYYDLDNSRLLHRLPLTNPSSTIQVSQDDTPLLYAGSFVSNSVDIYNPKTGVMTDSLTDLPTPTIIQNLK